MDIKEYYRLARVEDDHWWYRSVHRLVTNEVNKGWTFGGLKVQPWKTPTILDAGCGTGGLTEKLAKLDLQSELIYLI